MYFYISVGMRLLYGLVWYDISLGPSTYIHGNFFFEVMNIYIHRVTNLYTYFVRDMYFEMRSGRLVLVAVKVQIPILET